MKTLPNFTYKTIDLDYNQQQFKFHLHTDGLTNFGHFDCFDTSSKPIDGMSKVPYLALAKKYPDLTYYGVHQTHSTNISQTSKSSNLLNILPNSDAITSTQHNQALYIKTADCMPLILFNDDFISIVHLGHKGFFDGLAQKVLSMIKDAKRTSLKAYIGPSIQSCCFEVSADFVQDKIDRLLIQNHHIIKRQNRLYLNLSSLLKTELKNFGLKERNIISNESCTKCNRLWFSHRFDHTKNRISHLIFRSTS
ncbi:MAG: polyphenol oxidase family protein [Candidatus Cloacimonetes bacterium]|nr:polyphenol oxidase family protein [Candidatus Cloacimonadota bacterium]